MKRLAVIIAALTIGAGVAFAQSSAAPTSAVTNVEKWTTKQWNSAKKEWAKDEAKWTDCRQQSTKQKLTGRKSWSFLYTCMTTKS